MKLFWKIVRAVAKRVPAIVFKKAALAWMDKKADPPKVVPPEAPKFIDRGPSARRSSKEFR